MTPRAEARRRHLLETARALFVERGFHKTGIAQIAAASGIKVGQIYRDFHSKEDIIAAICERDVAAWLEEDALAEAVAANDLAAVRRWMDRFLYDGEPVEESQLLSEIVAEGGRNARIAELNRSVDVRIRNSLSAALTAIASGEDRTGEREALIDFILAIGIGIKMRRAFDPDFSVALVFDYVRNIIDRKIDALSG